MSPPLPTYESAVVSVTTGSTFSWPVYDWTVGRVDLGTISLGINYTPHLCSEKAWKFFGPFNSCFTATGNNVTTDLFRYNQHLELPGCFGGYTVFMSAQCQGSDRMFSCLWMLQVTWDISGCSPGRAETEGDQKSVKCCLFLQSKCFFLLIHLAELLMMIQF